jgi:hypothetical protein
MRAAEAADSTVLEPPRDPNRLADEARSKLYVAVTRARHSVAFVI